MPSNGAIQKAAPDAAPDAALDTALAGLPAAAADPVRRLIAAGAFRGVIAAADAAGVAGALPDLLPLAALYARPPISGFPVGAVARGLSGALYLGANIEFPGQALNTTVHAEQAAIVNAWANGERGLSALAVSAAPCGHCRQFLNELASPPAIQLSGRPMMTLSSLLPEAFGPRDLGIAGGLMEPARNGLTLQSTTDDPLVLAALAAADASYAPYTSGYAGVALRTADGAVFQGRSAENAAFNPGMAPLQAAVVLLVLSGRRVEEVAAAALVEHPARASHADATRALLASFTAAPLSVALAHPLQS